MRDALNKRAIIIAWLTGLLGWFLISIATAMVFFTPLVWEVASRNSDRSALEKAIPKISEQVITQVGSSPLYTLLSALAACISFVVAGYMAAWRGGQPHLQHAWFVALLLMLFPIPLLFSMSPAAAIVTWLMIIPATLAGARVRLEAETSEADSKKKGF